MNIYFSKKFEKNFSKCPLKIKNSFLNKLDILKTNEFNPVLNNHALLGRLKNYRSINVTGDYRAIFRKERNAFIFITIGDHNKLYN